MLVVLVVLALAWRGSVAVTVAVAMAVAVGLEPSPPNLRGSNSAEMTRALLGEGELGRASVRDDRNGPETERRPDPVGGGVTAGWRWNIPTGHPRPMGIFP